jgi:hypothetical protein
MQKLIAGAAFAVTLSLALAPATATDTTPSTSVAAIFQDAHLASHGTAPAVSAESALQRALQSDRSLPRVAPGQEREDFQAWMSRSPANRQQLLAFYTHLRENGVEDVVPVWQLTRTSSSYRQCGADGFEVAPRDKWDNIVRTLKFVDEEVVPAVGKVQAVSGYRNERLNRCSNGAPASAHRHFTALDLVPADSGVTRGELVRKICAAHARDGRSHDTGLGFYNGVRFHVDSNGFRRWGPNGSGATSPCVTYA